MKTRSGDRVVYIDHGTVRDLERYWDLRQQWQNAAGDYWPQTVNVATPVPGGYTTESIDLFFRQPSGKAWHPNVITDRFRQDTALAGLHDGRHAAATYLKAAGGDLLDMKKKLGHASITVTADTYPAGLEEIDRTLAERTAQLIPRQQPTTPAAAEPRATPARHEPVNESKPAVPKPANVTAAKQSNQQPGIAANQPSPRPDTQSTPGKYLNSPFSAISTRFANHPKHRDGTTKTQGAQRNSQAPPAVFLPPTPPDRNQAPAGSWPPAKRRTNRYPRDLK